MVAISDKQAGSTLASLHRLEFILQHKSDQLLRANLNIGFSQLRIMAGLSPTKSCSQRVLAHQLYQTEANISRQLRLLQENRLVDIVKHPKDKRQRQVKLTQEGAEVCSTAENLLAGLHADLLSGIDFRDAVNFNETIEKLARKIA